MPDPGPYPLSPHLLEYVALCTWTGAGGGSLAFSASTLRPAIAFGEWRLVSGDGATIDAATVAELQAAWRARGDAATTATGYLDETGAPRVLVLTGAGACESSAPPPPPPPPP